MASKWLLMGIAGVAGARWAWVRASGSIMCSPPTTPNKT